MHKLRNNIASARSFTLAAVFLTFVFGVCSSCFAQAGKFQFSTDVYFASESEGSLMVTVTRTDGSSGRMIVTVESEDINALAGVDYGDEGEPLFTRQIIFNDYQMSANFFVPLVDNFEAFDDLEFGLKIVSVVPDLLSGEDSSLTPDWASAPVTVLMLDNEAETWVEPDAGTIEFVSLYTRHPERSSTVDIELVRNGGDLSKSASVDYRIYFSDFTPLAAGSDYATAADITSPIVGTVTFPAFDTTAKLQITIEDDQLVEFNEDLLIELSDPTPEYEPGDDSDPENPTPSSGYELGTCYLSVLTILSDRQDGGEQPAGALDRTWNQDNVSSTIPPFNAQPGANLSVNAVVVQTNKTIIGGDFTTVNGTSRNRIARMNENGSLDTTFNPGTGANNSVQALALYSPSSTHSGKVLAAGAFTAFNGLQRKSIVRLNSNGSVDTSFNANVDGTIYAIAIQTDDKVLIGGDFNSVGGTLRSRIARLNANGTLDTSYDPGSGADGVVWSILLDPSPGGDKAFIGGEFTSINGTVRSGIAKLKSDGSIDEAFDAGSGTDGPVYSIGAEYTSISAGQFGSGVAEFRTNILVRADGGILRLYYDFINVPDTARVYYGPDKIFDSGLTNGSATVDIPFGPGTYTNLTIVINEGSGDPGTAWAFGAMILTPDNLFIGGAFNSVDGRPRSSIAKLRTNGPLDEEFDPGIGLDDSVFTLAVQPDRTVLIGGVFTSYNGTRRTGIARVLLDGKLDTSFADTAYNQFCGVVNQLSIEPPNFINAIAVQGDGNVIVGGSFKRIGGGYSRDDIRNRSNVARLIGGATEGPGAIEFVDSTYSADEGSGSVFITISRNNGTLGGPVSATFTTIDLPQGSGVATAIEDYLPMSDRVGWNTRFPNASMMSEGFSGPNSGTLPSGDDVSVQLIDDANSEGDETVQMKLNFPDGMMFLGGMPIPLGTAVGRSTALLVIVDNETDSGILTFSSPNYIVNETAGLANVTVLRTNGTSGATTVGFLTTSGSAVAGQDYTATNGTLRFSGDRTSHTFDVAINNDTASESDEVLYVTLQPPSGTAVLDFSSLDPLFNTGVGFDREVHGAAMQTNNVILVGEFTSFNGAACSKIARLLPSGALDTTFTATANDTVRAVLVLESGKVLIAGDFTSVNSTTRNRVALLNANGTLDTSFNPGTGPNGPVYSLAVDAAGKVIIGGNFSNVGPTARKNIARLNTNGSLDTAFNPGTGANGTVYAVALQSTNLIVGGEFTTFNNIAAVGLIRLIPSGSVDNTWTNGSSLDGSVKAIAVRTDDTILIGGTFTQVNGTARNRIARLSPAGSLDFGFNPGSGCDGEVRAIRTYSQGVYSGRVVIGGGFSTVNGIARQRSAMLVQSGGLDRAYNPAPGPDAGVNAIALQPDNKVVLAGAFTSFNNYPRQGIARISTAISTVTIVDDDFSSGRAVFATPLYSVSENGLVASVPVQRSGGNVGTLAVSYTTIATNTASAGSDFTTTSGVLTWNNGDNSPKMVTIPIIDDRLVEGNEFLLIALTNSVLNGVQDTPYKYIGTQSNAVLTLVDDDFHGKFAFNAATYYVNEDGGNVTLTVLRQGGDSGAASVSYSTVDQSAVSPGDYTASSGTLIFADGESSKTIMIPISPDLDQDGNRTFEVHLLNPTPVGGAELVSPFVAAVQIVDEESFNEPPGAVDPTFNVSPGFNATVFAAVLQPFDQRVVVGGNFTTANGVTRHRIARLNADGTLDHSFSTVSAGANGSVRTILSQTDGRIIAGGFFTTIAGVVRNGLARLNLDGSLDTYFNPGSGADNAVHASVETFINGNRKILIGGAFSTYDGQTRNGIARVNDNGTVDTSFNPGAGVDGVVYSVAVQSSGMILIGGDFRTVNGLARTNLARLNADGSVDATFTTGTDAPVRAIVIQADGQILVGGLFTNVLEGSQLRPFNRVARLNATDGAADVTFAPAPGANDAVYAIALQVDSKILLGGEFTRAHGVTRNRITRLNPNGTVDPTINFGFGADGFITTIALQADGRIVAGGGFSNFDGIARSGIVRLHGGAFSTTDTGGLEFLSAAFQVSEGETNSVITVRRRGGTATLSGQDAKVDFSTSDGTGPLPAVAGSDYVSTNGTLTFVEGEVIRTFIVPILPDTEVEGDESLNLTLSNFRNLSRVSNQTNAVLTISDDDCQLSFSAAGYRVNESSGSFNVSVIRTGRSSNPVAVNYRTLANGSASTSDFGAVAGTLVFAEGETNKQISITITADTVAEGDETFAVELTTVFGATLRAPSQTVVTIVDDDFAPGTLSFSADAYTVDERIGVATITVVRTSGSTGVLTVNYASSNGTAVAGMDFTNSTGTLVFPEGVLTNTFILPIIDDEVIESDETVELHLWNVTGGGSLGLGQAIMTIADDDLFSPKSQYRPGTLDVTFDPGTGANGMIRTLAVQSDGRIVVGGAFTKYDEIPRNFIARLDSDGPLDATFNPGTGANALVSSVAILPDGKIAAAGAFTNINGTALNRIAHLTTNGLVSTAFNQSSGVNAAINALAAQTNGKLLVGGGFNVPTAAITRILANGAADTSFAIASGANGAVHAVVLQPDGKALIAGDFTAVSGYPRSRIARLSLDGSVDLSFTPPEIPTGRIYAVAVQWDGKIVIGGDFTAVGGLARVRAARLNGDGSLDATFDPGSGANAPVFALAVQPDGLILVGGDFTSVGGVPLNRIARLQADGTIDARFEPGSGPNGPVYSIASLRNGKTLIAGDFTTVNGFARNGIARLNGDDWRPRFISQQVGGGTFTTRIATVPSYTYVLEINTELGILDWNAIQTNIAPVDPVIGGFMDFTNSLVPDKAFYRIRQLNP